MEVINGIQDNTDAQKLCKPRPSATLAVKIWLETGCTIKEALKQAYYARSIWETQADRYWRTNRRIQNALKAVTFDLDTIRDSSLKDLTATEAFMRQYLEKGLSGEYAPAIANSIQKLAETRFRIAGGAFVTRQVIQGDKDNPLAVQHSGAVSVSWGTPVSDTDTEAEK